VLRYPEGTSLPRVDIVYAHAAMDSKVVTQMLKLRPRGLILAGVGEGNAASTVIASLQSAAAAGVLVVRASRIDEAVVERNIEVDDDNLGFVAAGTSSPQKARILLQLLIFNGIGDPARIQEWFDGIG
jgi:L-asparaginase